MMHHSQSFKLKNGFILLPVVFTLTILAAVAYLLSREGAINAGNVNREQQQDAALYVAQAGYNHAIWQLNQANCSDYSDLINVNFGSNRYNATITPTSGSPVNIGVTGVHAQGANYTINRDAVTLYQSPPLELTLQPGAAEMKDTFIDAFKSTWNHGIHNLIRIRKGNTPRHILLKFDLTGIPSGIKLNNASLELYLSNKNGSSDFVNVHRLTTDWLEGDGNGAGSSGDLGATWDEREAGSNWTTAGGDYDSAAYPPSSNTVSENSWQKWDVTSLVNAWIQGSQNNFGMILIPENDSVENSFESSDGIDPNLYPKLTISYACECGIDCPLPVSCDADYIANNKVSEFATSSYSSFSIKGLSYLPEGKLFKSIASPSGGAWVSVDSSSDEIYMTDLSGSLLASNATPGSTPTGVSFISSGTYADHLVVSDFFAQGIAFVDLTGTVVNSINTASVGAANPVDIAFIGTTASGSYDGMLALLNVDGMIYIIDQSGTLQTSIDVTGITSQAEGIVHLPGKDLLMLVDQGLDQSLIIDFSGNLGNSYSTTSFNSSVPYAITINPLTCEHAIGDLNVDKVITVDNFGGA
jgi:hypothetical protein